MVGSCEHCGETFAFDIFHSGFSDMSYAYCDTCGLAALLSGWSKRWPKGVKCTQAEISTEMQSYLKPCECGGSFNKGGSPRCPKCKLPLSPEKAAAYIEPQAPGTKKGWRWQRSWDGMYCFVIEGRKVNDNFLD